MQADLLSNWTLDTLSQSDHYCVHGIQFLTALVDATDISEVQTLWCKVVFLLSWVGKQPSVPSEVVGEFEKVYLKFSHEISPKNQRA